ncbi:MAG: hypothetical protein GWN64_08955 [Candidatus Thorarchaeota archaeon]|nr:hypothetical protein [Candidatus Thorarchaeota archaeon]
MKKIKWKRLKDILDPTCTIRLWTASGSWWASGHFESFWRKKKAFEWAEKAKDTYDFVDVTNELTGECVSVKVSTTIPVLDSKTGRIIGYRDVKKVKD